MPAAIKIGNDKGEWTVSKNFVGFDDFIPIFQGGKQIDSQGLEHDGDDLIDQAVAKFDPSYHEAPLTIGHPKDNSPAFGWVESIKKAIQTLKDGTTVNMLMAKFKDVVPEFAQAVQQGLYKKRSASFYPDGRLRHVGFLGGMPPAVKGLADLKFKDDEKVIEFEESIDYMQGWFGIERIASLFRGLRDFFIEKFGKDEMDKVLSSYDIDSIHDSADQLSRVELPQTADKPLFSEEGDMPYSDEQTKALLDQQRERLTAEFAEKEKKADEAIKFAEQQKADEIKKIEAVTKEVEAKMEAKFAEKERQMKADAHKKEVAEFVSSGINTGKILPAWEKMGLAQFMEGLPSETAIEFGEGEGKISKTPYDFFKSFMTELPKTINFGEFATRDKNVGGQGGAGAQLDGLISVKMKADPKLTWGVAFNEVQLENRQLVQEYEQERKSAH